MKNEEICKYIRKEKGRLLPDFIATGDHCVAKKNLSCKVLKYSIFIKNDLNPTGFDEVFLYHGEGKAHYNKITEERIETPHVHDKNVFGEVRRAASDEIPK